MVRTYPELGPLAADWDELARLSGTPFMTYAWLSAWWSGFGEGEPIWLLLQDADGSLRAGAFLHRRGSRLDAAANVHSGDWNGLARDEPARAELWEALAQLGANRVQLQALPEGVEGTRATCDALAGAGYSVVRVPGPFCPWLELPASWDELIGGVSGSLRSQVKRRRKGLEKEGVVSFRTVTGGPTFEEDLETFLKLEASGWKAKSGTAILSQPSTERLYREFAHGAAGRGWMRLYMLELDGEAIAADYGCAYEGRGVFIKTGFNEVHSRLSPGLVLRAEVLRSSIEEGLDHYDFLGEADVYKTRWTPKVHPRVRIFAYRGTARPGYVYRKAIRPLLKSARDRLGRRSRGHG
jgi:CelD/BcsL family acetyltransferase involved in cellulose biosynthesis